MTVRVVVADDQTLLREGLCGIIGTDEQLRVVAQAGTGDEAVAAVARHHPDVVLMDIRMPQLDGLTATGQITATTTTKVLILTTFDLDEYVFRALQVGASGFLLKDSPPRELLAAIKTIAAGDAILAPSATRRLIAHYASTQVAGPTATTGLTATVTPREREVLALVATGHSNAEIAATLHISPGTVKTHVAHLLTKLDVRDRIQLAIQAHRAGIVGAQPPAAGHEGTA